MSVLAVALLLLAGWSLTPPGRAGPRSDRPRVVGHLAHLRARLRSTRRSGRGDEVSRVLVEVATRLRAGTSPAHAWARSLPEPTPGWAAPVLATAGLAGRVPGTVGPQRVIVSRRRRLVERVRRARAGPRAEDAAAAAAAAACRLARQTGAPLAEVIDVVVAGIAEAAEADELRRAALAGPRATARLLAWLPAGGVAMGMLLGADPLAVLLGGGVGSVCLVGGVALFVVGRRWVGGLVGAAERAGQ